MALVKAWKGDKSGNLIYRMTARNFNPNVATAGKIAIAEVEQLVEVGELDPDQIHTPGIFVQRIVLNAHRSASSSGRREARACESSRDRDVGSAIGHRSRSHD